MGFVTADIIVDLGVENAVFSSIESSFGPGVSQDGVVGVLAFLNGDDAYACSLLPRNPANTSTIAVIKRGAPNNLKCNTSCYFVDKVYHAQQAGYAAVIIYNNITGGMVRMGGYDKRITIPSVGVSMESGFQLQNLSSWTATITADTLFFYFSPTMFYILFIVGASFISSAVCVLLYRRFRQYSQSRRGANLVMQINVDVSRGITPSDHAKIPCRPYDMDCDGSDACCVCLEDYKKGDDLSVLPCKHKFHKSCLEPWLVKCTAACPICKR